MTEPIDRQSVEVSADVREVLRRRRESLARAEDDSPPVDTVALLVFDLGDQRYAVPADAVHEVQAGYTVARIPCTPAHILGVMSVRGEIVSVTDLGALLDVPTGLSRARPASARPAILVAEGPVSSALVVDDIVDIIDVPASALEPPLALADRRQAPLLRASVEIDGRMVAVVDCATLLEPIDSTV